MSTARAMTGDRASGQAPTAEALRNDDPWWLAHITNHAGVKVPPLRCGSLRDGPPARP